MGFDIDEFLKYTYNKQTLRVKLFFQTYHESQISKLFHRTTEFLPSAIVTSVPPPARCASPMIYLTVYFLNRREGKHGTERIVSG